MTGPGTTPVYGKVEPFEDEGGVDAGESDQEEEEDEDDSEDEDEDEQDVNMYDVFCSEIYWNFHFS